MKENIEKLEYHEESESCTTLACVYGNGGPLKTNLQSRKIGSMDTTPRSTERNVALSVLHQVTIGTPNLLGVPSENAELRDTHPDIHYKFESSHHVMRSNRNWAGLSTDLVIEQVLRSMKITGGLTRGGE